MEKKFGNRVYGWLVALLMLVAMPSAFAQKPAGTTADRATRVSEPVTLTVQSGSNFIRIDAEHLPATVKYIPGADFCPVPVAMVAQDTIDAQRVFANCQQMWQWTLEKAETAQIMEIKAHENAIIHVMPHMCDVTFSDTTAAECGGLEWNGVWYDESGDYAITLTNVAGCDSIRTLHLTVYPQPENTDTTATVWDSIAWYGTMYTADGDYSIAKKDENGCDYLHTLHLTVLHTLYDTVRQTACDSLEIEETIYRESALILLDTTELESKDRKVNYLDLTILHTTFAEITEEHFDSYTAPWGDEYTESGDYVDTTMNVAGCDSITTLHLTIHATLLDTLRESGCDSIDIDGVRYKQSGEYADTTLLENGDRVARTIYLTIGHSTYQEENVTGCEEYISELGNVYTESGTYEEKTINDEGCDAFITLHVTIITDCTLRYDTAYYCRGFNTEHEEQVEEFLVRRYIPYAFESPADIWEELMDGVELANESTRTLMDLNRAEANIRGYYIGGLTPVETIGWSTRNVGAGMYEPVAVEAVPQWIPAGMLAVQIHFRCGEIYNTEFPMAIEQIEASQAPAKRIKNGQIIILRGDAVYTPLGQRIH